MGRIGKEEERLMPQLDFFYGAHDLEALQLKVSECEPGKRVWAEKDGHGFIGGTWEPYEGDEEIEKCSIQSVRWQGDTVQDLVKNAIEWLEGWRKFKEGGQRGRKTRSSKTP